MIIIEKMRFFEPKKFLGKSAKGNHLPTMIPYFRVKNQKKNDLIFHKVQKTQFLDVFWPKFAEILFSKIGLRHIPGFIVMHLCAKNQKI